MMALAPPLSACLMIIFVSFANDDIAFYSEKLMFRLIFDLSDVSSGMLIVLSTKLSNSWSQP